MNTKLNSYNSILNTNADKQISLKEFAHICKTDVSLKDRIKLSGDFNAYKNKPLPVLLPHCIGKLKGAKTLKTITNNGLLKNEPSGLFFIDIDAIDKNCSLSKTNVEILRSELDRLNIFTLIKTSPSNTGLHCFIRYDFSLETVSEFDSVLKHYIRNTQRILDSLIIGGSFKTDLKAISYSRVVFFSYDANLIYNETATVINEKPIIGIDENDYDSLRISKEAISKSNLGSHTGMLIEFINTLQEQINAGNGVLDDATRFIIAGYLPAFLDCDILQNDEQFDYYFKPILNDRVNSGKSKHKTYESIKNDLKRKVSIAKPKSISVASFKKFVKTTFGFKIKYNANETHRLVIDKHASEAIAQVIEIHKKNGTVLWKGEPGIGKTYLLNKLNETMGYKVTGYATPTTALATQYAKTHKTNLHLQDGFIIEGCTSHAMTYASCHKTNVDNFEHICLDEAHNMVDSINYMKEAIYNTFCLKGTKKTLITATPDSMLYYGATIEFVRKSREKQNVRIIRTNDCNGTVAKLGALIKDKKFLYYDTHIENINSYKDILNITHFLDAEKKETALYKSIVEEQVIPEDALRVGTTKLIAEGINLNNVDFNYILINNYSGFLSLNDITQIVARFRKINIEVIIILKVASYVNNRTPKLLNNYYSLRNKVQRLLLSLDNNYNKMFFSQSMCDRLNKYIKYISIDKQGYLCGIEYRQVKRDAFISYSNEVLMNNDSIASYYKDSFNITFEKEEYSEKIEMPKNSLKRQAAEMFLKDFMRLTNFYYNAHVKGSYRIFEDDADKNFYKESVRNFPPLKDMCDRWYQYKNIVGYKLETALSGAKTKNFLKKIDLKEELSMSQREKIESFTKRYISILSNALERDVVYSNEELIVISNSLNQRHCFEIKIPDTAKKMSCFLNKHFNYTLSRNMKCARYTDITIKLF